MSIMSTTTPHVDVSDRAAGLSFWEPVTKIAEESGTPFFLYFPHRAAIAYKEMVRAVREWGDGHIAYSLKTNPTAALLRDLHSLGSFVEVVSAWELAHAHAIGFNDQQIVFNGPLKTRDDLAQATRRNIFTINVDSTDEVDILERSAVPGSTVRVGLRVCPPKHNGTWSRFGIEVDTGELDDAILRIRRSRSLELHCVHFHLGTQITDTSLYVDALRLVRQVWERCELDIGVMLDVGGGFPYDHALPFEEQLFSPSRLLATLADAWGPVPRPPLLVEPGRFIAAPAMAVVSRVLAHKPRQGEPTIVVLDSGTNHNVMAAFYEHLWSYLDSGSGANHRLCGPLCMEDDILSGQKSGPPPKTGSLVAMFNAGAYSLALSRAFIQGRPPIFALHGDDGAELVQPSESGEQCYPLAPSPRRRQHEPFRSEGGQS